MKTEFSRVELLKRHLLVTIITLSFYMASFLRWLGEERKCGASEKSPSDWFFLSSFTFPFLLTLYGRSVTFLPHENKSFNTCGSTHSNEFS